MRGARRTLKYRKMTAIRALAASFLLCACQTSLPTGPAPSASTGDSPSPIDSELVECRARIAAVKKMPALPGAPELEAHRAEILGRARGEPVLFLREPATTRESELSSEAKETLRAFAKAPSFRRVKGIAKRHQADKAMLRALLLREGYVYSSDPHEALALVTLLDLPKLFDEPTIFLQRGSVVHELHRVDGRFPVYRHADGTTAELLFADRVAVTKKGLEQPITRDLRSLAWDLGFDRARIEERRETALVASLRFGGAWVRTLLEANGARLSLGCIDATIDERARVKAWLSGDAQRRAALQRLHAAIDEEVAEALPFDRPRREETAERDGQLRPNWRWAFLHGQSWFSFDDESYPVFDSKGRPFPPQVCVDFVLDSFERASGTWFEKSNGTTGRVVGSLDFDAHGITNRRGVLAFEKFAEEHPALFTHTRFTPEERIPFGERTRFFRFLSDHADRFRPGDIVAIQGRKADGNIHQHAILIEDTDPLTGFPDTLADQMKRPRRRTWEGIMAEAPLRSLLFHVRPTPAVLLSLAGADSPARLATQTASPNASGG